MGKQFDDKMKSAGEFKFEITDGNKRKLHALELYSQALAFKRDGDNPDPDPDKIPMTTDGLINFLLDDITNKWIGFYKTKHGFMDNNEFVEVIGGCADGEKALDVLKKAENRYYRTMCERIASKAPQEDPQQELPFAKKASNDDK